VAEVDKGKGPVAIAQRSKVKAVLVDAEWHSRVEEELAQYRKAAKRAPLKLHGSVKIIGDLDQVLSELRQERAKSLEHLIARLK
jgi:PHD/YefM family antitoxin component YafN of YafNO toxin-antitoxin module